MPARPRSTSYHDIWAIWTRCSVGCAPWIVAEWFAGHDAERCRSIDSCNVRVTLALVRAERQLFERSNALWFEQSWCQYLQATILEVERRNRAIKVLHIIWWRHVEVQIGDCFDFPQKGFMLGEELGEKRYMYPLLGYTPQINFQAQDYFHALQSCAIRI
jgi:hypothetical protein